MGVGNVFEAILEKAGDADHAMKVAPIAVIRLLILFMQALLVWYVYSVAHWDLNSSSDGYWHVGMASPKNYFDSVQMTFSVSFIIYFGLISLTKLYVLSPMNMYGDSYKAFVNGVTNHFDEIAVFILSAEKADFGNMYMCPVYKTEFRGPTFVFCANLKTKSAAGRWTLAGVALIMELTA